MNEITMCDDPEVTTNEFVDRTVIEAADRASNRRLHDAVDKAIERPVVGAVGGAVVGPLYNNIEAIINKMTETE